MIIHVSKYTALLKHLVFSILSFVFKPFFRWKLTRQASSANISMSWEKLRIAQHEAWALVDQAVTEDERTEKVDKKRALPLYKAGLEALNRASKIDISDIEDEPTRDKAVRLKQKIERNIDYVRERISLIESLISTQGLHGISKSSKPSVRNNAPRSATIAKPTQPKQPAEAVKSEKFSLKGIDKALADAILQEIVEPAGKGPKLDDVIGLDDCKAAMNEAVILPALRPDLFTGLRVPPKGVLLFGPPGNGKTLLARAVANQANATFFSVSASTLMSKWLGESERLVRALFAAARQLQPSVIFLDECDSLLSERRSGENDATRRVKTEFLVQTDGLSAGENDRVVLLAATNRPWDLDSAALRRMPRRIYLPLPGVDSRASILRHWFDKNKHQCKLSPREIDELARETDGYSAADMTQLLRDAALEPLRELSVDVQRTIDRADIRPVNYDDVRKSMRKIRPSAHDPSMLKQYQDWNSDYGSTGI